MSCQEYEIASKQKNHLDLITIFRVGTKTVKSALTQRMSYALPPINLLLVDDSIDNCYIVELFLKDYPITIDTVHNGLSALNLVKKQGTQYDLILMDLEMPVMGGLEATREMRKWESANNQKRSTIGAFSASVLTKQVKSAFDSGYDFYIPKPISRQSLIYKIKEATQVSNGTALHWEDIFLTGVDDIDFQHREIFSLTNELDHKVKNKAHINSLEQSANLLLKCFTEHFKYEEAIFSKTEYPEAKRHISEHSTCLKRYSEIQQQIRAGKQTHSNLVGYISSSVINHYLILDQDCHYFITK